MSICMYFIILLIKFTLYIAKANSILHGAFITALSVFFASAHNYRVSYI